MDGYLQTTLAANSIPPNAIRTNSAPQTTRIVAPFPPSNKDFNCNELHTPDGIYPLLHETFFEMVAPQFTTGTRASIVSIKDEMSSFATGESDEEEEGIMMRRPSMTPVKSAALPIPNTSSTKRNTRTVSIGYGTSTTGLQTLTSPQKLMTTTASGNDTNPYFPFSPTSPTQQQPQQFTSGSYMMSSSHELQGMSQQGDYGLPSPLNSSVNQLVNSSSHTGGSVSSLSSLFSKSTSTTNPTISKSASQLSSSIARSMSTSMISSSSSSISKPKNHLSKTTSTFVLRFLIHENLQKMLATKALENDFIFFNIGTSFFWVDSKNKPKEPLSRIIFSKTYPLCHDINDATRCEDHLDIILGFSTGDIVWYEPLSCKYVRLNKGGCLVPSAVTMIRWIPGSEDLFFAIFKNGTVLIMDKERDDQSFHIPEPNSWVESEFLVTRPHKSSKYNPVSCWKMGDKGLTDLCFSPDGVHMAITSVDGKLRLIDYRNERLTDVFLSYFGKLNCVDWSPDGRYILTGGEDDLVTIWSFIEKRMVARCEGHKSWVSSVAFDRWKCDEHTYRFGSVGEDCNLILWDFSYSTLKKPKHSRIVATSPSKSTQMTPTIPLLAPPPPPKSMAPNIERKKSLKSHLLFRGFSSSDTSTSTNNSSNSPTSSFSRFRKRSSRSNNLFSSNQQEYTDPIVEDQIKQHFPVLHPPIKKNQAAILLPTTINEVHPDPCLSLLFRENTMITTDRRGRIYTWGRP